MYLAILYLARQLVQCACSVVLCSSPLASFSLSRAHGGPGRAGARCVVCRRLYMDAGAVVYHQPQGGIHGRGHGHGGVQILYDNYRTYFPLCC